MATRTDRIDNTPVIADGLAQTVRGRLMQWYGLNGRDLPWRRTVDPYRIWISEIMLQQTQVKTVIPYYERFLARFPDVSALAASDLQDLLKIWEGLGYYARARNLHNAAKKVVAEYGGRVPDSHAEMLALPGVGGYVAAAVLSFSYGIPHAVVDGNVKRVLSRLLAIDLPVNRPASHRIFEAAADRLLDRCDPAGHNQAVMELGALVCTPRSPRCSACPLAAQCKALAQQAVSVFPVRERRKPVPERHLVIGVFRQAGRLLIGRRPAEGLLGGLWEFPGANAAEGESSETAGRRFLEEATGVAVGNLSFLSFIRHAYSHFKISAAVFLCEPADEAVRPSGYEAYAWADREELSGYPLTGVARKILPLLEGCEDPDSGI